MGKRQKIWARGVLDRLRLKLGAKCACCRRRECLEFDCIQPMGDEHHRMSLDQRATFYRRQEAAENLQILCERCHHRKTNRDLRLECTCLPCLRQSILNKPSLQHTTDSFKFNPAPTTCAFEPSLQDTTPINSPAGEPF